MNSVINPKGYGAPVVGLFTIDGKPITFAGLNKEAIESEHYLTIAECMLWDDFEEGIELSLTLESVNPKLIDSEYFDYGNTIIIRFGYMVDENMHFGRIYQLIVKDHQVSYDETQSFSIDFVDQVTFHSQEKDQSNEPQVLEEASKAILQMEGGEDINIDDYHKAVLGGDKGALEKLFKELDKIRNNFKARSGEYVLKVPVKEFGARSYLYFPTVKDVREYFTQDSGRQQYAGEGHWSWLVEEREGVSMRNRLTNEQIFNLYAVRKDERSFWSKLKGPVWLHSKDAVDLYGYAINSSKGEKLWRKELEKIGILDKLKEIRYLGMPNPSILYDSNGEFDPGRLDEFLEEFMDSEVLEYVQADMNKSGYNNLKEYLIKKFPDHNYVDKADGNGPVLVKKDTEQQAFMDLVYKGGSGDLLKIRFDTDFQESEVSQSEATIVDPETGEVTKLSQIHSNQTGNEELNPTKRYVDDVVDAISNGEMPPALDTEYEAINKPGFTYGHDRPAYQDRDGNFVPARDSARRIKRIAPTTFYSKPGTVEEILREIDSRKEDKNLKRIIADAEILGNPYVNTGQVFNVKGVAHRFTGRYFALSVQHKIDPNSGYVTTIELGKIPKQKVHGIVIETEDETEVKRETKRWKLRKSRAVLVDENRQDVRSEPIMRVGRDNHVFYSTNALAPFIMTPEDKIIPNHHVDFDLDILEGAFEDFIKSENEKDQQLRDWGIDVSKPFEIKETPEGLLKDASLDRIEEEEERVDRFSKSLPYRDSVDEMTEFLETRNVGYRALLIRKPQIPDYLLLAETDLAAKPIQGTIVGYKTIGTLKLYKDTQVVFECYTLEPPWKNNQRFESRIPGGQYEVMPRFSLNYGHHFHIKNVKDRTMILIHRGNRVGNTEGCILVGMGLNEKENLVDSAKALNKLNQHVAGVKFTINII